MCELFAMSSRFPTHVHVSMKLFAEHGGHSGPHKDGWGVAYYQGTEAWQTKAAESAAYSDTLAFVEANAPATNLMLSHIRLATHGTVNLQNTQPFSYPLAGKRMTFMHNGHVPELLHSDYPRRYTPIGDTDSEAAFSIVMNKLAAIEDVPTEEKFQQLETFLVELAEAGPLNLLFTDSEYLYAFSNKRTQPDGGIRAPGMHLLCRQCSATEELDLSGVSIGGDQQELVLFASVPLSKEHWRPMTPNKLYIARQGTLIRQ